MASPPSPQRAYRAACPNCGAPVEFASAASASAVCSYCRSTLVRDGESLRKVGESAELFEDHSPLQLGVSGRLQGVGFTLVGRLQYGYAGGTWNEWHALFDSGRSGWLSEDNGAYVFAFDLDPPPDLPAIPGLQAGRRTVVGGSAWDVASVTQARIAAAQGELPRPPRLEGEFLVADLRNAHGEVGTIDASEPGRPQWSIGRSVTLAELAVEGLRDAGEKTLSARTVTCPNCGASIDVKLGSTKTVSCPQCQSVVDLGGVGTDLAHYAQNVSGAHGIEPQIPLGRVGRLALGGPETDWQVVGYQERCDLPEPGDDDEQTFWREYLLYSRTAGFAFLVDTEEGWSWVRPLTGVPVTRGDTATWQGDSYRKRYGYAAKVTWVLGEFYWRVRREERARVTDYDGVGEARMKRLSREEVAREVTWSAGEVLDAAVVADAFGLPPAARGALQRDAAPVGTVLRSGASGFGKGVVVFIVLVVLLIVLSRCGDDDCDRQRSTFGPSSNEYRQCLAARGSGGSGYGTSGGSWGGYSSGGSHK